MEKVQSNSYSFQRLSESELTVDQQGLIEKAKEAAQASYSPYSKFQVGAALLLADGSVIKGANQENASYPAGLCAERVALFQAGATRPDTPLQTLAVVAKKVNEDTYKAVAPCGSCRQVMLEYETKHGQPLQILFKSDGGWVLAESSKLLLPFCFDKHNL